jgi:hypothetical protein
MHSKLYSIPNKEDLINVRNLIKPYIIQTPVLTHPEINRICGADVFFKCENFQSINNKFTINLINQLDLLIKQYDKKPYNRLLSNKIFKNYHLFNALLFEFNNKIYNINKYFLNPPEFNKSQSS